MNQSKKETFLVRVQEIETKLRELKSWVAAPMRIRVMTDDGTLNASSIARKLSKELGMTIPREVVIKVGKSMGAKPTYYKRQHISRYSPEDVEKIMGIFRNFYQNQK